MSRVVDRRFIFDREETQYFSHLIRALEHFTGVRVLTYCLMSNHFHLLLEVPDPTDAPPQDQLTDQQLLNLIRPLYGSGIEKGQTENGAPAKQGFNHTEALKEIAGGGTRTLWQALRCRVRYFADGTILGKRAFIKETFQRHHQRFGKNRKSGPR